MKAKSASASNGYVFRLLGVVLTVAVIYVAKPVLVPLALAVLFAFVLSPLVRLGVRRGLGNAASVLVAVLLALAVAATLFVVVGSQIAKLAEDLPNHEAEIRAKLKGLRSTDGGPFARLATMVSKLADDPDEAPVSAPTRVEVVERSSLARSAAPLLVVVAPLATFGLILVLTVFILIRRDDLKSRLLAMLGEGRLVGMVRVIEDSAVRVGRYLLFQLLVNAMLGAALSIGLAIIGVPYAPLWGVITATLRFIPYVGTWIAMALPLALSFAISPSWHQPVIVLVYVLVLDLFTANVIEPLLFGRHTGVSPIALLIAAVFWSWVWGPIGLLLSTPLTVCLTVMGQHIPAARGLGLLLGDKPALAAHIEYYQRVLSHGGAAAEAVAVSAATGGAEEACDRVLIPALALARADRKATLLTAEEDALVREATRAAIPVVLAADTKPVVPTDGLVVIGTPACDEVEEIPLHMIAGLVARGGGHAEVLTARLLPSAVERRVVATRASVVVISNFRGDGLPQTLHLCRLLREHHPELLIIVAWWGGASNYDKRLVSLRKAGASYLTTSLGQTMAQLRACTSIAA